MAPLYLIFTLPGQAWLLQSWDSVLCPWQSAPPCAGEGLLQVLVLVWVPPPQVVEHSDQSSYSPHPPSTEALTYIAKWHLWLVKFWFKIITPIEINPLFLFLSLILFSISCWLHLKFGSIDFNSVAVNFFASLILFSPHFNPTWQLL